MDDFKDKRVLITGASKGLGWVTAKGYAERGARVLAAGRDEERLDELIASLPEPGNHSRFAGDLSEAKAVGKLAAAAQGFFTAPDIIVHAMGGGYGFHDPLLSWEKFELLNRVNFLAGAELNRLLVPEMEKAGAAYIIHVGSTASTQAIGSVAYNTIKAGLAAYVRSIGNALASGNVIVTGILPGGFYAPGNAWRRMDENAPEVVEKFIEEKLPRGRLADAEEILPLLFLLSGPGASMLAGTCVAIDAGESVAYAVS